MRDPGRIEPSAAVRRLLLPSPVGPLLVEHGEEGLRAIRFWEQGRHPPAGTRVQAGRDDPLGWAAAAQLREYFAGVRKEFDLPVAAGGTAFRRRVWEALRGIPYGSTRTYAEVAAAVGTRSARAVGQANRHNPVPIVVPCHRVVAAAGIGGYAGQSRAGALLDVKRWLLHHEGAPGH
jgi:methylated-DNA-[protein]-cysteine S-methyltransferase